MRYPYNHPNPTNLHPTYCNRWSDRCTRSSTSFAAGFCRISSSVVRLRVFALHSRSLYSHSFSLYFIFISFSLTYSFIFQLLGSSKDALKTCKDVVCYLIVALGHTPLHPLIGLQLFTLGEQYDCRLYRWPDYVPYAYQISVGQQLSLYFLRPTSWECGWWL